MEEEASELGVRRHVRLGQFAREERLGTKQFELGCFPSPLPQSSILLIFLPLLFLFLLFFSFSLLLFFLLSILHYFIMTG